MRVRIVSPQVAQSTTWSVFIKKIQRRPIKYDFWYRWHVVLSYGTYQLIIRDDFEHAEDLQVPHSVARTFAETEVLAEKNIAVVFHPAYSPDVVPCNLFLSKWASFPECPGTSEKNSWPSYTRFHVRSGSASRNVGTWRTNSTRDREQWQGKACISLSTPSGNFWTRPGLFFKRLITQRVCTVCTRINYKIVPVTNCNKYLHYGTSGTE